MPVTGVLGAVAGSPIFMTGALIFMIRRVIRTFFINMLCFLQSVPIILQSLIGLFSGVTLFVFQADSKFARLIYFAVWFFI